MLVTSLCTKHFQALKNSLHHVCAHVCAHMIVPHALEDINFAGIDIKQIKRKSQKLTLCSVLRH